MIDNELIKKARQAHLAEYLLGVGIPLIKTGNRHRHKEHNSLIFTENAYYWNSLGEHGNAIDYLVRHMGMGFVEAVVALVNAPGIEHKAMNLGAFDFTRISKNGNHEKIKSYLAKTRFIAQNIIEHFIANDLLFQEEQTNNAIFSIYDENNNCVGAEVHGITAKRYKGVKANSKYGYGFNVRFSDDNSFDYALFFESAIDLISFIDCKMNHEKKPLTRCILISMAGLKINVLKHSLKTFKGRLTPVICVDNDTAGQNFKNELQQAQIEYINHSPDVRYKDWNEQLTALKKHSKPISRLMNRGLEDKKEQQQTNTISILP